MTSANLVIPGITDSATLMCIARSRSYTQYCNMVDDALMGRCPFCPPDPVKNPIIFRTAHWNSWQNPHPEEHILYHFIIAPKNHYKAAREMALMERAEMFILMDMLQDRYGYPSQGILIRDGDATRLAGTIQHLHVHVMVPDGTGRVESPLYKGIEDDGMGLRRAVIYEKIRQGTSFEALSPEEQKLVEDKKREVPRK